MDLTMAPAGLDIFANNSQIRQQQNVWSNLADFNTVSASGLFSIYS